MTQPKQGIIIKKIHTLASVDPEPHPDGPWSASRIHCSRSICFSILFSVSDEYLFPFISVSVESR